MKYKILFSIVLPLFFVLLFAPSTFSQPSFTLSPTYQLVLSNDTWDGAKVYTVDVTLISTDTTSIEYATSTIVLAFNESALNGGTLTATWVAGTTSGFGSLTPALDRSMTDASTGTLLRLIKLNGKIPPGYGNGPKILTGAGTKIGTLKLTASADSWVITGTNRIDFCPQSVWPSNVNVYIYDGTFDQDLQVYIGTNTNIWANKTLVRNLTSLLLPVELSSFVSNVNGRQVNLSWETKTETNTSQFEIERSLIDTKVAAATWASVGTVKAAGTSTTPKKYSYTEKNLQTGKYQYRIKMIDNDGSYKLSDVVETEIALPKNFELSQNYPNPFNPSTRINYSIPFDSRVTLDVYNITGERMGQIVNQEQSAGYYTVNFSSSALNRSVASGVYIYKINAVDNATGKVFTSIKKMMLLK